MSSKVSNRIEQTFGGINIDQISIMQEISKEKPSNWSCLWQLHDSLFEEYKFIGDRYEMYPGVLFLANVSEIEK